MGDSILDAIGNTPLVTIRRLNPNPRVRIVAKLEYFNPGGSIKDRPALAMIEAGERSGELTPDRTVIEATSGNTGIGLALVCSIKGYRLLLAMSESASIERRKILKARGADILLTPGHLGTDGAIEEVYRLAREHPDTYFMADQYNNPANWQAHYFGTAEEIWRQTGGDLQAVVATMGTTGTLMGISRRLKELNPEIRIIGVEPYLGHKLQGLKNMKEAYCPELYEKGRLDEKVNIDDEEAFEMTRCLARTEGLFVGMSSGAATVVACKVAERMTEGTVAVILPDGGERYLSTSLFTVRETVDLRLFNTLSREKDAFVPGVPGKASVYSCGPTAYRRLHPAEYRRFIFSDLLCRYLTYRGFEVTHVMNITDLDDNTIAAAEKEGVELAGLTERYVRVFHQDLDQLGIHPADHYPRAGQHVDDMVALAERLVKKGVAYEKLRSLYFDISKVADYGKLSGVDLDKIRLGATVDLDEYEKDNPRDFTLLKRSRLSELKRGIYVKTPWGNVRPSWHIQCAAISMKYLGESFDIHTSNRDLVFPHHENEMAIAGALTGKPLARYWLHCERARVDDETSGDADSRLTLDDLAGMGYDGRTVRFWLLSAHHRKPMTFSRSRLKGAKRGLNRIDTCIRALRAVVDAASGGHESGTPAADDIDQLLYDIKAGFVGQMDDDLNVAAALANLFRAIRRVNGLLADGRIDPAGADKIIEAFRGVDGVLRIFDFGEALDDPRVRQLIREREAARKQRDFARADQLRDELTSLGVSVRDGRVGSPPQGET